MLVLVRYGMLGQKKKVMENSYRTLPYGCYIGKIVPNGTATIRPAARSEPPPDSSPPAAAGPCEQARATCLSVLLSVCLSVWLSICLSVICPSVRRDRVLMSALMNESTYDNVLYLLYVTARNIYGYRDCIIMTPHEDHHHHNNKQQHQHHQHHHIIISIAIS